MAKKTSDSCLAWFPLPFRLSFLPSFHWPWHSNQISHRRTHCHVILTSFSTVSTFSGSMDSIRFICICMKLLSWCRKLVQISDEDVMIFLETESDASVHRACGLHSSKETEQMPCVSQDRTNIINPQFRQYQD